MKLTVKYMSDGKDNPLYKIEFILEDNDDISNQCFIYHAYNRNNYETIDIKKLNSEKGLEELNIKYIKEKDEKSDEKQIIPIGIVNFEGDKLGYQYNKLFIDVAHDDLPMVEQTVKNIKRAIKLNYEFKKIKDKFQNKYIEEETIN